MATSSVCVSCNVTTYLLNHPEYVEYVLARNNRNFVKGERVSLGFLGNGLLTSEGSYWRRQRRLAQPAFHRERISAYGKAMVERAELTASAWRSGETGDVHEDMARLALEIVAETLFGTLPTAGFSKASAAALATIARRFTGRGGVLFQVPHAIPTPGNALSCTWYLLAEHPEAEKKLLAELGEVLGDRSGWRLPDASR